MKQFLLFILPMFLLACQPSMRQVADVAQNKYAKGFTITEHEGYTEAVVYSPWKKGEILGRYYLVKDDSILTPFDGLRVRVPINKIICTSSTHIGFLQALGATDIVAGVCNKPRVYTPLTASCIDLGEDMQLSAEQVLLVAPEAVLMNTYGDADPTPRRLEKTGVPLIFNIEWTEQHPLGRAEWIRFVGALVDKQAEADSIFTAVCDSYHNLCTQVSKLPKATKLMTGNNFRGTWYMPAGNTYMGQLIHDAGAVYPFEEEQSGASIPLSLERCLMLFQDADVWIGSEAKSLAELKQLDEKHSWFNAYQTGRVYNFARRTNEIGANDFWETGTVHPDYILQDMIWILHPDEMPDYTPFFTQQLP